MLKVHLCFHLKVLLLSIKVPRLCIRYSIELTRSLCVFCFFFSFLLPSLPPRCVHPSHFPLSCWC